MLIALSLELAKSEILSSIQWPCMGLEGIFKTIVRFHSNQQLYLADYSFTTILFEGVMPLGHTGLSLQYYG